MDAVANSGANTEITVKYVFLIHIFSTISLENAQIKMLYYLVI